MAKLNKAQMTLLREALKAARLENCAVADEHKNAMQLYLDTWVVNKLELLVAEQDGLISMERIKGLAAVCSGRG